MIQFNGYIMLHRPIRDHWTFKDPEWFRAWVDILLTVQYGHETATFKTKDGMLIRYGRAEYPMSLSFLASRWNWSIKAVRTFLAKLEKDDMITKRKTGKQFVLKVTNYDKWQSSNPRGHSVSSLLDENGHNEGHNETHASKGIDGIEGTMKGNEGARSGQQEKNTKKDKNIYTPPQLDEFLGFFKSEGYREDMANKAYRYYADNNWKDSNNRPVRDWKRKVRNVWFTEQNKLKDTKEELWKHLS